MTPDENVQPALRQRATEVLRTLPPSAREALLVKCWMSHDARWFMAVAGECGMDVTNRLNQMAAHEVGKVEAYRIVRALGLPPVRTLDDYLLAQEVFIGLLGPELLDHGVERVSPTAYRIHVRRCFAHDNAARAGVGAELACGIFARGTGWLEALGLAYEMDPCLGKCLKAGGRECLHTLTLRTT